ncbi:MAG: NMD3-related protein [Candidatus Thorarchaeota archaeon]
MPNRFCAICGKDLDEDSPHIGMCIDCYLKEHPLFDLPKKLNINVCLDCGSYSKKDIWIKPSEDDLFLILSKTIQKFLLKPMKKSQIDFSLSFNENSLEYSSKDLLKSVEVVINGALKDNSNITHNAEVKVIFNHTLCSNCSNIRGGTYFVSILQLRVNDESQYKFILEVLEDIQNFTDNLFKKDQRQYVSRIEDQKYGVDLYLSTNELMNHIIKYLKSRYHFLTKRTKKLVGRDNQKGKNLYRLKTSIKFLPFSLNDSIMINNVEFYVENITKNKIILRNKMNDKLIKDYSYFLSGKDFQMK